MSHIDFQPKKIGEKFPCEECGVLTVANGAMQRYCPPCSANRVRLSSRKWARDNARPRTEAEKQTAINRKSALKEAAKSKNPGRGIGWYEPDLEKIWWTQRFSIPFDKVLSKNAIWSNAKGGSHVFVRREHKAAREAIAWTVRQKLRGQKVYEAKVWVDLLIQKPNHRMDAINYVDGICDALKVGIGVDDNWFSIKRLDWEVVKNDPKIYIGIGQEASCDQRVCSYCGQILELNTENFGKSKHQPKGFARVCKPCSRLSDRNRRRTNKERRSHVD